MNRDTALPVSATSAGRLLAEQRARFAALDRLLPVPQPPPDGHVVTTATADGARVAGTLVRLSWPVGTLPRLWSAAEVAELHPLLGAVGGDGMDALLATARERLTGLAPLGEDSACVLTWPSRDVAASRALLDHGMVPLSVIAVRIARAMDRRPPAEGLTVRLAGPADLPGCVRLALAELAYSAHVGGGRLRPNAEGLKQASLRDRFDRGDPVWVAERDGELLGMAECGWTDSHPGTWAGSRLQPGRWGYVNCAFVSPGAREQGVGRALLAATHRGLQGADVVGSYLYFNPANPLSSVFWPRQAYRPLWTIWEVRPAAALR